MMERWVSPVGAEWAIEDAAEAIEIWERESGLCLPDDYRSFMGRHNGGRPYPLMFIHTAREPGGEPNPTEHFVNSFSDWDHVVSWTGELGNRLPGGCIAIGGDPGLIELILSLRPADYGHVYSWVRNWGVWSSPDNDYLCPQARSFRDFVQGLSENDDEDGYDYWYSPASARTRRLLEF